jgi:hypothetical protein
MGLEGDSSYVEPTPHPNAARSAEQEHCAEHHESYSIRERTPAVLDIQRLPVHKAIGIQHT